MDSHIATLEDAQLDFPYVLISYWNFLFMHHVGGVLIHGNVWFFEEDWRWWVEKANIFVDRVVAIYEKFHGYALEGEPHMDVWVDNLLLSFS